MTSAPVRALRALASVPAVGRTSADGDEGGGDADEGPDQPGSGQQKHDGAERGAGMTVEVVVAALRQEATMWDEQARTLGTIARASGPLGLTGLQAGIFARMADASRDAAQQVAARCAEGQGAMHAVADALRASATAYDERDAAVADHVAGTY